MSRQTGTSGGAISERLMTTGGYAGSLSVTQDLATFLSSKGRLWGVGTPNMTVTTSMNNDSNGDNGSVFWMKNTSVDEDIYLFTLIPSWNGGTTTSNKMVNSKIYYASTAPTADHLSTSAAREKISSTVQVTDPNLEAYFWDDSGTATGMTQGSDGFFQLRNYWGKEQSGQHVKLEGQPIMSPGVSLEIRLNVEETGEFGLAVVYGTVPQAGLATIV